MTWEKADQFVESDVIEWIEAIWPPKSGRRRTKPRPIGKQKVIAQIAVIEGDFFKLTVLKSEILENESIKPILPHKTGTTITKKRSTLLRGEPQRLHWSEEDVRRILLSDWTK